MTVLLYLAACASCVGLPDSVPANPGTVSEEAAGDLLTATSPDLAVIPWATLAQLSVEDYRDCPLVYVQPQSLSIDAGGAEGCLDSAGIRWEGSASATFGAGGSVVLSFNDFGPVSGVPGEWSALGTITLTGTASGTGIRATTRMEVTSRDKDDPASFWSETAASYAAYDGVMYADHVYGTVGLGDWGTADVDTNRLPLSLTNGCPFGMHAAGTIALFGQNTGVFSFSQSADEAGAAGAPPPHHLSADTGDTGDTGRNPGDGSSADLTIPNPTGDAGTVCGECASLSIQSAAVAGCVQPTHTLSYPFIAPF